MSASGHHAAPHLDGPVTVGSLVQRRAGVHYTEVAGAPLLCDVRTRRVHLLSPGAAMLWARLDGRPIAQVVSEVAGAGIADVIELVRRLRAVGVVEDVGRHRAGPVPALEVAPAPAVTLRARIDDVGGTTALLLDDADASDVRTMVAVSVGPPIAVDGAPLGHVVIGRHSVDPRQAVLQALLGALVIDGEPDAATVEALAVVGETVPVRIDGPLRD